MHVVIYTRKRVNGTRWRAVALDALGRAKCEVARCELSAPDRITRDAR